MELILIIMVFLIWYAYSPTYMIYGCDGRGDGKDKYLRRTTLFQNKNCRLYFHKFYRSDEDDLHDHPWDFYSLILWRGYNEVIQNKKLMFIDGRFKGQWTGLYETGVLSCSNKPTRKERIYPGMIIHRKAEHFHRVELIEEKPAYTLVFVYNKHKTWGFLTKDGWMRYTDYFTKYKCW